MFYGRKKELDLLSDFYNSDAMTSACIYGREGMGKTSLLKEFAKDKRHIYFNAYNTTGAKEVELFARAGGFKKKFPESFNSLEILSEILSEIKDRIELDGEKILLIIDNYPAFARSEAGFDEAILSFTKDCPGIKFIACGDSYLAMSKIFWEKKSIWKENISLSFELLGLGFYETMEFLTKIEDPAEKACIYGLTGGIPGLLSDAKTDTETTIKNIFFGDKKSPYAPENIMQKELRELSYYNHILTTLAGGFNRVNQISKLVGKPKDVVVPYMNTLMSIGVVTKENPVTEKTNRKKTRYSIINSFDLFWYRFFAPFMDIYDSGEIERLMELSVEPGFSQFMKTVFVSMCKEYLERRAGIGDYPFTITEIGNWWQNDDEKQTSQGFDLVAVGEANEDEAMVFGCCYYTDEPVGITLLKELIDLTKRVKGKKNVFYLVFSKSGFHENTKTVAASIKNIILVSLEDIING